MKHNIYWIIAQIYLFHSIAISRKYLGLFMENSLNLNREEIGTLYMILSLFGISTTFIFSYFCDEFMNLKKYLLKVLLLASTIIPLLYLIPWYIQDTHADWIFNLCIGITILWAMVRSHSFNIIDSTALHYLDDKTTFGSIRLWATVGSLAGVILISILLQLEFSYIIVLITISIAYFLAFTQAYRLETCQIIKNDLSWKKFLYLIKDRSFLGILIISYFNVVGISAYYGFYSLLLNESGAEFYHIAISTVLATLSQIVILKYAHEIIQRYDSFKILSFCFAIMSVRWLILSNTTQISYLLASQLIHALSGLIVAVWINFIQNHFTSEFRTSGITLYSTLIFGLGSSSAFYIAGKIVHLFGFATLFQITFYLSLIASILSYIFFKCQLDKSSKKASGIVHL